VSGLTMTMSASATTGGTERVRGPGLLTSCCRTVAQRWQTRAVIRLTVLSAQARRAEEGLGRVFDREYLEAPHETAIE
jgi:hypothetical protein